MDIHVYALSRVIYIQPAFDFLAAFGEKIQNEAQTLVEPFTGKKEIADEDLMDLVIEPDESLAIYIPLGWEEAFH